MRLFAEFQFVIPHLLVQRGSADSEQLRGVNFVPACRVEHLDNSVPFDLLEVGPRPSVPLIVNLVVNARDAMPTGGHLTISTKTVVSEELPPDAEMKPGTYILLEVCDTGVGMSEDVRSHIFEPFFTTKAVGKGTGLGLATVYGIVQQTGGHVDVKTSPGSGCAFRIYLPSAAAGQAEAVDLQPARSGSECRETILVVENERGVRALMVTALTDCGYTVLEAANGVEALQAAEEYSGDISLLLTDVVMPMMGGVELWEKLGGRIPEMRVLFTSGHTDIGRSTLPGFLKKPFSTDDLTVKVQDILAVPAATPKRRRQTD